MSVIIIMNNVVSYKDVFYIVAPFLHQEDMIKFVRVVDHNVLKEMWTAWIAENTYVQEKQLINHSRNTMDDRVFKRIFKSAELKHEILHCPLIICKNVRQALIDHVDNRRNNFTLFMQFMNIYHNNISVLNIGFVKAEQIRRHNRGSNNFYHDGELFFTDSNNDSVITGLLSSNNNFIFICSRGHLEPIDQRH